MNPRRDAIRRQVEDVVKYEGPAIPECKDMLEVFREIERTIEAAPAVPRYLIARHDVPYGTLWRMWRSDGVMIGYCNRGEIADMPRYRGPTRTPGPPWPVAETWGIPIYVE